MHTDLPALRIDHLTHKYGDHVVLKNLSLSVAPAQLFALLGPNGSGKSTLFRIISTLAAIQEGAVSVFGRDVVGQQSEVRRQIGVVFQSPALDKQLTIRENLTCHAALFGLSSQSARRRSDALLERFEILNRANDLVIKLSGGMRRKVELVKALLTEPSMLILDEPSTGLDVNARIEMWKILEESRKRTGLTVIVTTHLMEEADRCDEVGIIDKGVLLAHATPAELKKQVGGDVITFSGPTPSKTKLLVEERLDVKIQQVGESLRLERDKAHLFVPQLIECVPGMIESISIGRPTLDDVFIHYTGRHIKA